MLHPFLYQDMMLWPRYLSWTGPLKPYHNERDGDWSFVMV